MQLIFLRPIMINDMYDLFEWRIERKKLVMGMFIN